jgi:hypothetical protein
MAFTESKIQAARDIAQSQAQIPRLAGDANYFGFVVGANELMLAALVIFASILGWHAIKTQRARPEFNLIDLILGDDGKISPEKFIVMVAFSLHSWTILKWIITGIVSTADFVSYGTIWVAPLVASIIKGKPKEKPA